MAQLNFYQISWYLDEPLCPCDVHFLKYLEHERLERQVIFHFGTGGHHVVGIRTQEAGTGNLVLGITASPQEHDAYEKLVIERPELGRGYKVLFGDIYQLEAALLPQLDIATLFHVGEFRTDKNDAYGALTDEAMMRLVIGKLRPGGLVLLYSGSYAYDVAERIAATLVGEGVVSPAGSFETLKVLRKAG
jgi:hypothetical protein